MCFWMDCFSKSYFFLFSEIIDYIDIADEKADLKTKVM